MSLAYSGTAITTTATFTNPGSPTPVDPSTVTLKFRVANGSVTTWVYQGAGSISKVSTGIYSAELDTTTAPGDWTVEWLGTGACAAVNVTEFSVAPAPL